MGLLIYQVFSLFMIVETHLEDWTIACPSCPSISSKDLWSKVVPLAIKVPSYVLVLAIALSVISVIIVSYCWIALYWASFSIDHIRRRRIFHKDVGIILCITWIFGFVGFIIICHTKLSMPLIHWYGQMDEVFIGWVRTIY